MNKHQLLKWAEKYAESQGFNVNEDKRRVNMVLNGLLANEKKYGFRYCPCRIVTGNKEEDKLKICPCYWHKDEIKKDSKCKCGLFTR